MTYQATIIFAIRLTGNGTDVSIRDQNADLMYNASIRPSDHINLRELMDAEGFNPRPVQTSPTKSDCVGWANTALAYARMSDNWSIDVDGARSGHIWQAGGWVEPSMPAFTPYAFPLKYKDAEYYRPGVVSSTGVRTDFWIIVQPK